ncbi:MAG TPA: hypothetical protein VIL92_08735 [Gaiellaceae bacterium]|jgi:hypothetical protein
MSKLFARTALVATFLVALLAPSAGAAKPVINDHEHFTSDPYADGWCGIQGDPPDRCAEVQRAH